MAFKLRNPDFPFSRSIPEGLSEGKALKIKGHIRDQAQRFEVNLVCANGDIAFHFNPRFDEGPVVVCNTKRGCFWGPEERPSEMPFQQDASFKMTVIIRSHCYQVSVNSRRFLEYRHRCPTQDIRTLKIEGDIDLKKVTLKDIPDTKPEYLPGAGSFI